MNKASFGKRAGGYIIDGIVINIVNFIFGAILGDTLGYLVSILFGLGYFVYFWSQMNGQTPGKIAMKTKVVKKDGSLLTPVDAVIRYVGYIISAIPLGLGFWWALFDANGETWADKIAGTSVVDAL